MGDDTHGNGTGGVARDDGQASTRSPGDMGQALRTVYQKAVEEAIPDEMLDLLGKLD